MNEVNRLHNEYEIKQLPILQIAKLHKRGQYAILHKLSSEGLIHETWNDVRGWKNLNDFYLDEEEEYDDDDYEESDDFESDDSDNDHEYESEIEDKLLPKQKPSFFQSIVTTIKLFITSALS
jgi:hypothetical protein